MEHIRYHLWNGYSITELKIPVKLSNSLELKYNPVPFSASVTYRIRPVTGFELTWAIRRVSHVEHNLLNLPEHQSFVGVRVAQSVVFYGFFLCTIVCLLVFFFFSHGVVSLFLTNEFESPFGIFRLSSSNCLCNCPCYFWIVSSWIKFIEQVNIKKKSVTYNICTGRCHVGIYTKTKQKHSKHK